jgi:hypothetical protein
MGVCDLRVTTSKRIDGNLELVNLFIPLVVGKPPNLGIKSSCQLVHPVGLLTLNTSLYLLVHILCLCCCSCIASLLVA